METEASSFVEAPEYLRRYTDLPALLSLLRRRQLTLLNPSGWDDKNDAHYLKLYKSKKKLAAVLALCLTAKRNETYHHWRVFAPGNSGVCVTFRADVLLEELGKVKGVRWGRAQYRMMNTAREAAPSLDALPFLKRYAFRDEAEFRIIYEHQTQACDTRSIDIALAAVSKVTLNPWAPPALQDAVRETIRAIDGCQKLKVGVSSLINNKEWRRIGAEAA